MKSYLGWGVLITLFLVGCLGVETDIEMPPQKATVVVESVVVPSTKTAVNSTSTPVLPTPTSEGTADSMNTANADVIFVRAVSTGPGVWSFHVTVEHPDTGWEDYADGWDLVLPDGTAVKPDQSSPFTRLLLHPHETEQPFTRSQSGIIIPAEVTQVTVRAHDLVHGFGGKEVVVDLTAVSGPDFEVEK